MFSSEFSNTFLFLCLLKILIASSIACGSEAHSQKLIDYGAKAVQAYAHCKHGPDGKLLLDNFISPFFDDFDKKIVLDAGCGAGPWSKLAAQNGAIVHGIDIQSKMIEKATQNLEKNALESKIFFQLGDVRFLPYPNAFFDRALSINLICNLPSNITKYNVNEGLKAHFSELFRVLKRKGRIIVSGPGSMAEILTNGKRARTEVIEEVKQAIAGNRDILNEPGALKFAEQFTDVLRASFILEEGKITLVDNENQLKSGQKVLRKIPGLSLFMHYYPEAIVINELENAGFEILKVQRPVISANNEDFSHKLGPEYKKHNPFFIIEAKKA